MAETDDPTLRSGFYASVEAAAAATATKTKTHHHNTRPPRKHVRHDSEDGSGDNFDTLSDPGEDDIGYDDDDDGGGKIPATSTSLKYPPLSLIHI